MIRLVGYLMLKSGGGSKLGFDRWSDDDQNFESKTAPTTSRIISA